MIVKQKNEILEIKPINIKFIKSFKINSFNKKYKNHDIILVIDFLIDVDLTDIIYKWVSILKKTNNFLIIVVDNINEDLLNNQSFIFVPTIKEAIDYINLEKINKHLDL